MTSTTLSTAEAERRVQLDAALAIMADRDRRDAAELEAFAATLASFFDCPRLREPGQRIEMQETFRDLRVLANRLGRRPAPDAS